MMRSRRSLFLVAAVAVSIVCFGTLSSAAASPKSVQFNGNTYYVVNGNDKTLDSGNKVCAAVGMNFLGYKSINTTGVCKTLHPTAKEVVSVNGSKAGFYCNGAPQQGLACAKMKNTCQVCPNCNLNEAADGNQTIGQHFAEMYVWCGKAGSSSSAKNRSPSYGPMPLPRSSARSSIRVLPVSSSSPASQSVTCTFAQKPLKRVTCSVLKAADTYCALVMQSTQAKAIGCQETGNVICSLPCSAPGASNLKQCAFGGIKQGFCPPPAPKVPGPGTKTAGQQCQHGGDCQSGMCLGVVPGKYYVCSCNDPKTRWQSCTKN